MLRHNGRGTSMGNENQTNASACRATDPTRKRHSMPRNYIKPIVNGGESFTVKNCTSTHPSPPLPASHGARAAGKALRTHEGGRNARLPHPTKLIPAARSRNAQSPSRPVRPRLVYFPHRPWHPPIGRHNCQTMACIPIGTELLWPYSTI